MFRRARPVSTPPEPQPDAETAPAREAAALPSFGDRVVLDALQREATVGAQLGQGGQGAVFVVDVDGEDEPSALKWYFPLSATARQELALRNLVDRPSPHERFLWPRSLAYPVDLGALDGFGYVMRLRPAEHVSLVRLVQRTVSAPYRTLATIGLELAHGFLSLHNEGLCYRDISFGNVFFEPTSGRVLICDNDNVGIDGRGRTSIRGTPYFMAPEIVRGEAVPSRNTDLWSLAVLLFYVLINHHPLEGAYAETFECWDETAMRAVFGDRPRFIFDPDDASNGPVPGLHDHAVLMWEQYPSRVRELFVQAFTKGIADPDGGRVLDSEWRAEMAQLRDVVVYCQACGSQNLHEEHVTRRCWSCTETIVPPPRLKFGARTSMVLNHDTELFPHHLERNYDYSHAIGAVRRHPENEAVWGLQNLGATAWSVQVPNEAATLVIPGRSATLTEGLTIDFGSAQAVVTVSR